MVVNSLHGVLLDVFGGGGFKVPPGKPLYSYRCSYENYHKIRTFLKDHAHDMGYGKQAPVFVHEAFCLYVAEWVRRNHKTGHVRWCDITDSLNWPVLPNTTLTYLTESGLKYWKRPLRSKGNKPAYLLTLVLEGGLPLRMMEDHHGMLVNYFKRVLTGIRQNTNQYLDSSEIAESLEELLPKSLRNPMVFSLAGEFCNVLHQLATNANAYCADIVPSIKRFKADWYKELPVVLDETKAEALAQAIYAVGDQGTGYRPTLKVQREWIKNDEECWYCEAQYKLPISIKHGSLIQYFELDKNSKASRLILRGVSENDSQVISLLSKSDDDLWMVEKYPASRNILTGSRALKQISYELYDGVTLVGSYIPSGGEALSEDLPWVLEAVDEYANELRFIGAGSLSATEEKVYLAIPMSNSMLMLEDIGEIGIPEIIDGSDRYLLPVTGNYTVRLEDGQCCTIKTGQDTDYAPHYIFGKASFKNVLSKYPIFAGVPVIYKVVDSGYQRVPASELYWRKLRGGVAEWKVFSHSSPIGKVEIRQVVDNEVLHSSRCIVFPETAQIHLAASTEKSGSVHFDGFGDVIISDLNSGEYADSATECLSGRVTLSVISKIDNNRPLNLKLSWPGMEPVDITLPFPAQGCRLIGADNDLRKTLTTNRLFGLRAEGVQIEGRENRFFVEIEKVHSKLRDPETHQNLVKAKYEMLDDSTDNTKTFSLSTLQAPLECLLSQIKSDETIDLRVYGTGCNEFLLHISMYPYQIYFQEQNISVSIDVMSDLDNNIVFYAKDIFSLDADPMSLDIDLLGNIDISVLNALPGAWLVYGELDGQIVTNQLLHLQELNSIEELSLVQRSFVNKEAAHKLITELNEKLASEYWLELLDVMNSLTSFNPRCFPVMELLAVNDTLLLATLFHSIFKAMQEPVWNLEQTLGFCWGSIPVGTWKETIATFSQSCQTEQGLQPSMLVMMVPALRSIAVRDWRARSGFEEVIRHISKVSGRPLDSIEMATSEQASRATQDLTRLVDGLPYLYGFSKDMYFGAFNRNPELKKAVINYWVRDKYAVSVQFLLNHIMVAAALTLLEPKDAQQFKALQPLLNLAYQQAPEHLGPIFNYFQNHLVK